MRDTDRDWELIAQRNPYWGVLPVETYAGDRLSEEGLRRFFESGEKHIAGVMQQIRAHGRETIRTAVDFGAGVGRLVIPMAKSAEQAIAIEVSPSMRRELKKNVDSRGLANVSIHATVDEFLSTPAQQLTRVDWVNSYIVFQHIPPSRGFDAFEKLLASLAPGGFLSVHFCIFRESDKHLSVPPLLQVYETGLSSLGGLGDEGSPGYMRMYDYDLNRIFALLVRHGIVQFSATHEDHDGYHTLAIIATKTRGQSWFDFSSSYFGKFPDWAVGPIELRGFSIPEPWGRWTEGPVAEITFIPRLSYRRDARVQFELASFTVQNVAGTNASIFVEGFMAARWTLPHGKPPETLSVELPPEVLEPGKPVTLRFQIDNPVAPKDLGLSSDPRLLGLAFRTMRLI